MDKWLDNKRLNIIQVAIYVAVLLVYLLAVKIEWFNNISLTVLIIGAILSVLLMLIRIIFAEKIDESKKK